MSLAKRLAQNTNGRADAKFNELRHRVHSYVIDELGPLISDRKPDADERRAQRTGDPVLRDDPADFVRCDSEHDRVGGARIRRIATRQQVPEQRAKNAAVRSQRARRQAQARAGRAKRLNVLTSSIGTSSGVPTCHSTTGTPACSYPARSDSRESRHNR